MKRDVENLPHELRLAGGEFVLAIDRRDNSGLMKLFSEHTAWTPDDVRALRDFLCRVVPPAP